jgi:hypothetical protein
MLFRLSSVLVAIATAVVPAATLWAQMEHVMFVTALNYSINPSATAAPSGNSFGSLIAADQICNARGQAPYLLNTFGSQSYKALLSDESTHARDRVTIAGRVINTAGQVLAVDFTDLWDGTIAVGVNYNEGGVQTLANTIFWTGSNQNGFSSQTALNWQSNLSGQQANVGLSQATANWFNQATGNANQAFRLPCLCEARVIDPGDFNDDGLVVAADYTVWRNTLGDDVDRGYFADGDGDGTITEGDYDVWKANYGKNYLPAGAGGIASAPEPSAGLLVMVGVAIAATRRSCVWRWQLNLTGG